MGHHHSFLMFLKGYEESSAVLKWALSLFVSCQKTVCHMWPVPEMRHLVKREIQCLRGRTMDGSPPLIFDVFEGLQGKQCSLEMGTVTVSVMPKDYVSHVASAGNVPPH
jgi:hypothetical protein